MKCLVFGILAVCAPPSHEKFECYQNQRVDQITRVIRDLAIYVAKGMLLAGNLHGLPALFPDFPSLPEKSNHGGDDRSLNGLQHMVVEFSNQVNRT